MTTEEYLDSLLRSVTGEAPPEKTVFKDEYEVRPEESMEPASARLSDFVSDLYSGAPSENGSMAQGTYEEGGHSADTAYETDTASYVPETGPAPDGTAAEFYGSELSGGELPDPGLMNEASYDYGNASLVQEPEAVTADTYEAGAAPEENYQPEAVTGEIFGQEAMPEEAFQPEAAPGEVYEAGAAPEEAYEAEELPGEVYEAGAAPEEAYEAGELPGESYEAEAVPGEAYENEELPGEAYEAGAVPEEVYEPEAVTGEIYGQEAMPEEAYQPEMVTGEAYAAGAALEEAYEAGAAPEEVYEPETVTGEAYEAEASPEVTYEAEELPGEGYEAEAAPEVTYEAEELPGEAYEAEAIPEETYEAEELPGEAYEAEAAPEESYEAEESGEPEEIPEGLDEAGVENVEAAGTEDTENAVTEDAEGAGTEDGEGEPEPVMSTEDLEALLSSLDDMGDPTQQSLEASGGENEAGNAEDGADGNASEAEGNAPEAERNDNEAVGSPGEDAPESAIDENMTQEDIEALLAKAASGEEEDISPEPGSEELEDLIADGEGDIDISEIGQLLEKDERNEAVDPSVTGILEDGDDAVSAILDEESPEKPVNDRKARRERRKKERAARREKKRLEKLAKKKKKRGGAGQEGAASSEELPDIDSEVNAALEAGLISEEDAAYLENEKKADEAKEKKGFFSRLINALTEEVEDDDEKFAEETAVDRAKAGATDNERILAELEGDGAPQETEKKEKKPKKEKKKKAKPKKKPKPKKAPKPKPPKKPKKPSFINTGPDLNVPKKKVALVMFMCLSIGVLAGIMSVFIPFYLDTRNARAEFDKKNYEQVFMDLTAHKLSPEDQELYDKNLILYKVNRRYDSYRNYMILNMRTEALNSLVQGIRVIGEEERKSIEYGVSGEFDVIANNIIDALENVFGVSIDMAQEWLQIKDSEEYTRIIMEHAGEAPGMQNPPAPMPPPDQAAGTPDTPDTLIEAEEAEFEGSI